MVLFLMVGNNFKYSIEESGFTIQQWDISHKKIILKNISYIVCDNGLGHVRRSYLIASKLSSRFKVNLFCNKNKFKTISSIYNKKINVGNIDLGFNLNYQNLKK